VISRIWQKKLQKFRKFSQTYTRFFFKSNILEKNPKFIVGKRTKFWGKKITGAGGR
jgi:hypothetical protein